MFHRRLPDGRLQRAAEAAGQRGEAGGGEVVFPDAHDLPALDAEAAGDEAVADAVAAEFFAPEWPVGGGERAVEGASKEGRDWSTRSAVKKDRSR